MRRVLGVVQDSLVGATRAGVVADRVSGVQIAVEAREIAAADLDPDAVARLENIARHPEVDLELVDLAGCQQLGRTTSLAVAPAHDAVAQVPGGAVRENIDQLGGEI